MQQIIRAAAAALAVGAVVACQPPQPCEDEYCEQARAQARLMLMNAAINRQGIFAPPAPWNPIISPPVNVNSGFTCSTISNTTYCH